MSRLWQVWQVVPVPSVCEQDFSTSSKNSVTATVRMFVQVECVFQHCVENSLEEVFSFSLTKFSSLFICFSHTIGLDFLYLGCCRLCKGIKWKSWHLIKMCHFVRFTPICNNSTSNVLLQGLLPYVKRRENRYLIHYHSSSFRSKEDYWINLLYILYYMH